MNITFAKENIASQLAQVVNAASTKPAIPILCNVLLEAYNGQLCLTAFDTEMRIKTTVNAMVMEEGSITIIAKKFNEVIQSLPNGEITLSTDEEAPEIVNITCNKAKYALRGIKADTYPPAPNFSEEWGFTMGGKDLVEALNCVVYARSNDENRAAISGILFSISSGMRTIAATDGKRLALVEKAIEAPEGVENYQPPQDGSFVLPSKLVTQLIGSIDQSKPVNIHLSTDMVVFESASTAIMSKLVNKPYPNYRSVIPGSFSNQVKIPRALFCDVIKRMSMVATEGEQSRAVKLDISDDFMEISASSSKYGNSKETIDVQNIGSPISISFNPDFLQDGLKALKCDDFVLNYNNEVSPVEITGDAGFIYILMPMRNV